MTLESIVKKMLPAIREVIAISDRNHHSWDAVKACLAELESLTHELKPGDVIQEGDEYFSTEFNAWRLTTRVGQKVTGGASYRRRLCP